MASGFIHDGGDGGDIPVAFRVTWVFTERDRPAQTIKKARLTTGQRDNRTQAQAVACQADLRAQYGAEIAVSVLPVFRSKAERERLFKRRQASPTDGWPMQARMLTK